MAPLTTLVILEARAQRKLLLVISSWKCHDQVLIFLLVIRLTTFLEQVQDLLMDGFKVLIIYQMTLQDFPEILASEIICLKFLVEVKCIY